MNVAALILGLLLEIAALVAYTQLTHAVLPPGGPRRFRLFRINMSTLALSHVSPGGTGPGAALWYRLVTQSGVSGSDAGFALGTQGIGSAVVLNVMFWLALVGFLVAHGFHVPASHHGGQSQSASILVLVAAALGVVLLGAFGGLFYLLTRGQQRASRIIRRVSARIRFLDADRTTALVERLAERFAVLLDDRALLRRALAWAAANWLLDAASLWVFVAAFGRPISPIDLLTAYGLANILAAIPDHARRTRCRRVRARLDDHRVRSDRGPGPLGGTRLPGGELLVADTRRRARLRIARARTQGPPPPLVRDHFRQRSDDAQRPGARTTAGQGPRTIDGGSRCSVGLPPEPSPPWPNGRR